MHSKLTTHTYGTVSVIGILTDDHLHTFHGHLALGHLLQLVNFSSGEVMHVYARSKRFDLQQLAGSD